MDDGRHSTGARAPQLKLIFAHAFTTAGEYGATVQPWPMSVLLSKLLQQKVVAPPVVIEADEALEAAAAGTASNTKLPIAAIAAFMFDFINPSLLSLRP